MKTMMIALLLVAGILAGCATAQHCIVLDARDRAITCDGQPISTEQFWSLTKTNQRIELVTINADGSRHRAELQKAVAEMGVLGGVFLEMVFNTNSVKATEQK